MGCDIHAHIEVRIAGVWHHYSCPPVQRCYPLFARICGVRNSTDWAITPIDSPRGLPDDVSEVTATIRDFEGGHSDTWLSGAELDALIEWHESKDGYKVNNPSVQHHQWGYLNGNCFDVKNDRVGHPREFEDCRLVCWFDN